MQCGMRFTIETNVILHLAIPLTLIQMAEGMMPFVDTVIGDWLGTSALAAVSLGTAIFWTILSLFEGPARNDQSIGY